MQRTRAYETDLDVQRGLLVGMKYEWLDITAAVFNPDDSDPVVILGLTMEF